LANFFNLTLDTTGPGLPSISFDSGLYASTQVQNVTISTSDGDTTGYQMKIWGNVDITYDANVQDTEVGSAWITYATAKTIKLSATDGSKTVYLKIRDDVYNVSSETSDSITLDTSIPTVTVTSGPDVTKISKQTGKDTCAFSFQADQAGQAWKVKVVPATGSLHDAGTQIPITAGSTNMSGGSVTANTPINCTIKGADLEVASAGDGAKIIKTFVQDTAGNWST